MTTYFRNGIISGKFNRERNDIFDEKGKRFATLYFSSQGAKVECNDLDELGRRLFQQPDLRVYFSDRDMTVFVEAEIKSDKHWHYIYEGIDVPARKYKYAKITSGKGFYFMGKEDLSEFLLIPMKYASMAMESCGEEYMGHRSVPASANFVMPEHGCHRVRKFCCSGINKGSAIEDFVRIPYENVLHYVRDNNKFVRKI